MAVEHYFNGNGKDAELSWKVKFKLLVSPESKRIIHRLIKGEAKLLSHNFRVDLTKGYDTFHIGRTRVDYSTSCTVNKCITKFTAFSGDGFRDPLDIGQMIGIDVEIPFGLPYNYIPWNYSIHYNNPGYPVGNNLK